MNAKKDYTEVISYLNDWLAELKIEKEECAELKEQYEQCKRAINDLKTLQEVEK